MNEPKREPEEPVAPLARLYHENSKLQPATADYLAEHIGEFATDPDMLRRSISSAKTYPTSNRISLEKIRKLKVKLPLADALAARRSKRSFANLPLKLAEYATLLESAAGVSATTFPSMGGGLPQRLRTYPSAGALYCVETYVIVINGSEPAPGIYHYHSEQSALELVRGDCTKEQIDSCFLPGPLRLQAPAYLILTARWEMLLQKYQERGYRLAHLEAGHVAQNVLLVSQALQLAACPLAAFYDDRLASLLQLDLREESPLYVIAMGRE